jgi:hypothetical protein
MVVEGGALADVRGFLEGLERELAGLLSGYPLTEPLFQLMCHPVRHIYNSLRPSSPSSSSFFIILKVS